MSLVSDNFQFAAAAWVINERLIYHSQPGRMLAGLQYDSEGTFKIHGEENLPGLVPFAFNLSEDIGPGAPAPAHSATHLKNANVKTTQTIVFRCSASRDNSWFRRDPTISSESKGLMEWVALILDAIELDVDEATVDTGLQTATEEPFKVTIGETETTQLAFHCMIEIHLSLRNHCRSERASTLPAS